MFFLPQITSEEEPLAGKVVLWLYLFNRNPFEQQGDMLLYALEKGLLCETEVLTELRGLTPEETVQLVMDYGDMNVICNALLDFDEVSEQLNDE